MSDKQDKRTDEAEVEDEDFEGHLLGTGNEPDKFGTGTDHEPDKFGTGTDHEPDKFGTGTDHGD